MFGYITPLLDELTVRQYNYFRSYYCGICKEINYEYGNLPRMCLNYDMTFIGFLLDGLYDENLDITKERCVKHPLSKHAISKKTNALNYVTDLSILFSSYKLKDNIIDDNSTKSKVFYLALSSSSKKCQKKLVKADSIISKNLSDISIMERSKNFKSLDEISHPFSDIMGSILRDFPFPIDNDSLAIRENLYWLGYFIGKWIYLMDAVDDLKEDMDNSKFNPFVALYNKDNTLDFPSLINNILEEIDLNIITCLTNCADYVKLIPFKKHKDIIENTINLGMMDKYYSVLNKINSTLNESPQQLKV